MLWLYVSPPPFRFIVRADYEDFDNYDESLSSSGHRRQTLTHVDDSDDGDIDDDRMEVSAEMVFPFDRVPQYGAPTWSPPPPVPQLFLVEDGLFFWGQSTIA